MQIAREHEPVRVFADRRLLGRAGAALVLANARYWSTVAPVVWARLDEYRERAQAIRDPVLRRHALEKLRDQRFHAEGAATLATLAPRALRKPATEAIVAFEVMYDYLDCVTEQPHMDPLANGHRLFQSFLDALDRTHTRADGYYALSPRRDDNGYLELLVADARRALSEIPGADRITGIAGNCVARFSEAQIRAHAIPSLGSDQFIDWATAQARGTGLGWLEYFAGATSSVVGLHAMVAAAAADERITPEQVARIDAFYMYLGLVVTMLDALIDYERDVREHGEPGFISDYEDRDVLLQRLPHAARTAVAIAPDLPHGEHHVMTLVGAVAFYTSAPTAHSDVARHVTERIQSELQPLVWPTLVVMRSWRLAKRMRGQRHAVSWGGHAGRTRAGSAAGFPVADRSASAVLGFNRSSMVAVAGDRFR
jgi:tetraprenyl-beta-curcumene synthase